MRRDAYLAHRTPVDDRDLTIVDDRRRAKRLDRGVRILAVARRGTKGEPLVLLCHPLRTQRRDGDDGAATARSRKWTCSATRAAPWPNALWLCDRELCRRVGRLEHRGGVADAQRRVDGDDATARAFDAQQRRCAIVFVDRRRRATSGGGRVGRRVASRRRALDFSRDARRIDARASAIRYAAMRWGLMSEDEREACERWGGEHAEALRDRGVGGYARDDAGGTALLKQVKCLHAHYAHYLATNGDNVVGAMVQEMLDARADEDIARAQSEDGERRRGDARRRGDE